MEGDSAQNPMSDMAMLRQQSEFPRIAHCLGQNRFDNKCDEEANRINRRRNPHNRTLLSLFASTLALRVSGMRSANELLRSLNFVNLQRQFCIRLAFT